MDVNKLIYLEPEVSYLVTPDYQDVARAQSSVLVLCFSGPEIAIESNIVGPELKHHYRTSVGVRLLAFAHIQIHTQSHRHTHTNKHTNSNADRQTNAQTNSRVFVAINVYTQTHTHSRRSEAAQTHTDTLTHTFGLCRARVFNTHILHRVPKVSCIIGRRLCKSAFCVFSITTTAIMASTNCPQDTGTKEAETKDNIRFESHPKSDLAAEQTDSNETVKIYAPVMSHEVNIPITDKKEPMAIIPIPESQAVMGVPIETLSKLLNSQTSKTFRDEQHARDLLIWNDGIGTLDGCDLRFKINQLGCLELLDSDDETENHNSLKRKEAPLNPIQTSASKYNSNHDNKRNNSNHKPTPTTTTPSPAIQEAPDEINIKKPKVDSSLIGVTNPIRQISPGASLLRDGPNIRRPKTPSQAALLKKIENNQNSMLMEKLIPKQRLEELKAKVSGWTIDDVKEFVDSIPGCSGYGELFRSQEICGKSFLYLDQRDLLDVINVKLGPAVKIYRAISLLK